MKNVAHLAQSVNINDLNKYKLNPNLKSMGTKMFHHY